MSGHLVFVRFFPGYTESFPFDRFAGLRDEDIGGVADALRREWWKEPANRDRFERWRTVTSQRRLESDYHLGRRRMPPLSVGGHLQHFAVVITQPPWDQTHVPDFLTVANAAGWRRHSSDDFIPYCISPRYPVARFEAKETASDAASVLQARVSELAKGAAAHYRGDIAALLSSAKPLFSVAGEDDLSRPELAIVREQIQRLSSPVPGFPTEEERYLRTYWPLIRPTLEQLAALSTSQATPPAPPSVPPAWIRECFRQQQYKLLAKLWGGEDVPAKVLAGHLGYTKPETALDNLRRRVTEANKGLAEKSEAIGEQWEISQRTRDDALFYYLRRVGK